MPTVYWNTFNNYKENWNTFNNYKENKLFCHQNEGMLGRLSSGAEHHLQRHQNSPVKMRELQKHMPLISVFVLFQFF